jgi:hypothetical protein
MRIQRVRADSFLPRPKRISFPPDNHRMSGNTFLQLAHNSLHQTQEKGLTDDVRKIVEQHIPDLIDIAEQDNRNF